MTRCTIGFSLLSFIIHFLDRSRGGGIPRIWELGRGVEWIGCSPSEILNLNAISSVITLFFLVLIFFSFFRHFGSLPLLEGCWHVRVAPPPSYVLALVSPFYTYSMIASYWYLFNNVLYMHCSCIIIFYQYLLR